MDHLDTTQQAYIEVNANSRATDVGFEKTGFVIGFEVVYIDYDDDEDEGEEEAEDEGGEIPIDQIMTFFAIMVTKKDEIVHEIPIRKCTSSDMAMLDVKEDKRPGLLCLSDLDKITFGR